MLLIVVEVFADFFEDDTTISPSSVTCQEAAKQSKGGKRRVETNLIFSRTQRPVIASEKLPIMAHTSVPASSYLHQDFLLTLAGIDGGRQFEGVGLTRRIQHSLDCARDTGCAAADYEFETVVRDDGHVFGGFGSGR